MVVSNIKQFNAQMDAFFKTLVPAQVALFIAKISFELLTRLVEKTPVDLGRAEGAWQLTVDEVTDAEVLGGDVLGDAASKLGAITPNSVVYLSNNVPYIIYLERGSSKQAPQGMIGPSINEIRQVFP